MGTYGLGVSIGVSLSPRSCSWRRGLVGSMPARARTGDRADGELPPQASNLHYLIQGGVGPSTCFGQLARRRSLDEHGCPLGNLKMPGLARRNGCKTAAHRSVVTAMPPRLAERSQASRNGQ